MKIPVGAPGEFRENNEVDNPNLPNGFEITDEMNKDPVMMFFLKHFQPVPLQSSAYKTREGKYYISYRPTTGELGGDCYDNPSYPIEINPEDLGTIIKEAADLDPVGFESFVLKKLLDRYGRKLELHSDVESLLQPYTSLFPADGHSTERGMRGKIIDSVTREEVEYDVPHFYFHSLHFIQEDLKELYKNLHTDQSDVSVAIRDTACGINYAISLLPHLDGEVRKMLLNEFGVFAQQIDSLLSNPID